MIRVVKLYNTECGRRAAREKLVSGWSLGLAFARAAGPADSHHRRHGQRCGSGCHLGCTGFGPRFRLGPRLYFRRRLRRGSWRAAAIASTIAAASPSPRASFRLFVCPSSLPACRLAATTFSFAATALGLGAAAAGIPVGCRRGAAGCKPDASGSAVLPFERLRRQSPPPRSTLDQVVRRAWPRRSYRAGTASSSYVPSAAGRETWPPGRRCGGA